jgi:hypothetical protein
VKAFNVVATFTITDLAVLPWTVRSFRSYRRPSMLRAMNRGRSAGKRTGPGGNQAL